MRTYPKWVRKIKLIALYGGGGCIGLFVILFIVIVATGDNDKTSSVSAPESPAASAPESPAASESEHADANRDLFEALKNGTASEVKTALAAGADPNARDENTGYYAPLHLAAGGLGLEGQFYDPNPAVVKVLIEAGADPNAREKDLEDKTPLHYAALYSDNPSVIQALLDAGADPNARNKYGETPLHYVVYKESFAEDPNTSVIKALIEGGADPGARDDNGKVPFDHDAKGTLDTLLKGTIAGVVIEDTYTPYERKSLVEQSVKMVQEKGWRCDSIASFYRKDDAAGRPVLTLNCNDHRYTYEFKKDAAGFWQVFVD